MRKNTRFFVIDPDDRIDSPPAVFFRFLSFSFSKQSSFNHKNKQRRLIIMVYTASRIRLKMFKRTVASLNLAVFTPESTTRGIFAYPPTTRNFTSKRSFSQHTFQPLYSREAFSAASPRRFYSPSLPARTGSEKTQLPPSQHFRKVLIANRGEISIRVARTCRRLGIPTVAVYVGNDTGSKHITEADEAVCLGSSGTAYTDLEALLEAIQATGADAVHPGYGFLSENADFANAVQQLQVQDHNGGMRKVQWLGPPAQAIVDMGCKLRSKEIAKEASVAIIPGCDDGELESIEEALALMDSFSNSGLEYPVLLKAAAGGGGKGMRICRSDQELIEGFPLAKSEGLKFFADGRLLLEQYLEDPHHIEFQVICSKKENSDDEPIIDVAIFAERECSVQRRNQKVVEESPSCLLTEETRLQMMEQTALLCQKVGYEGAGTVEWLVVDSENDDANQKFFFLEMNTRLQVEHPVTEAVSYNVDLVEAMLEVGSGRGLSSKWYDSATIVETPNNNEGKMLIMPWKGHSIEGRIYAEDPLRGYLPSTGPLVPYKEPLEARYFHDNSDQSKQASSYLRLDSGVVEGHVGTHYISLTTCIFTFNINANLTHFLFFSQR